MGLRAAGTEDGVGAVQAALDTLLETSEVDAS